MRKLILGLALLACATARGTNITNYLQIVTADNGQLILLSDIGAHTNYNITVSNFIQQVSQMIATNQNNFSGSNFFSGPVTVINGNDTTTVSNLWVGGSVLVQQSSFVPTNGIPNLGSSVTNWVLVNMTNTINGGGFMYCATNPAVVGGFQFWKPSGTLSTWP